jgi:hypothetical protein
MSVSEKILKLRREAAELEAEAIAQEKHDDLLAALRRERAAAEQQLARGRALGERRETIHGGGPLHTSLKTGTEIAEEAERAIEAIDREIERMT